MLQVAAAAAFMAMVRHLMARGLQAPGTPPRLVADTGWQSYRVMAAFGLSIPVFFLVYHGWVVWIVVLVTVGRVHRLRQRGQRAAPAV